MYLNFCERSCFSPADKILRHLSIFAIYLRKKLLKIILLSIFYLSDYFLNFLWEKFIHPFVRAQVVTLHNAALNQVQISKQLKISRCCVQNAIKKYTQLI